MNIELGQAPPTNSQIADECARLLRRVRLHRLTRTAGIFLWGLSLACVAVIAVVSVIALLTGADTVSGISAPVFRQFYHATGSILALGIVVGLLDVWARNPLRTVRDPAAFFGPIGENHQAVVVEWCRDDPVVASYVQNVLAQGRPLIEAEFTAFERERHGHSNS